MKPATPHIATIPMREPPFRGERRLRIALVGLLDSGKSTFARLAVLVPPPRIRYLGVLARTAAYRKFPRQS